MEEFFPLLWPLMLCLKPGGLFSRASSPVLRSGWGLCVKIDLHSRRKKNVSLKMWFCSIFMFQPFFSRGNAAFLIFIWESWRKPAWRRGSWADAESIRHLRNLSTDTTCSVLCTMTVQNWCISSKENHKFKAGMCGNKVQNIKSRRKHRKSNRLVSSFLCGRDKRAF